MADAKFTALSALSEAPHDSDILPIIDVSDTSQAASGTPKKITAANLKSGLALSTHNHDSAYEAKNANIQSHISSTANPHSVTAAQAGAVPTSTTVNGKALSSNVTLTQDDVGDGTTNKVYTATEKTKLSGIEASANNYTLPTAAAATLGGVKVGTRLTITDGVLAADQQTANDFTTALKNKLDGIEAAADVTDATNVAAAGAVMEGDTTTASMSFVIDEDNMASNLATKVPTQQSVKAYVDAAVVAGGSYTDEAAQDAVGGMVDDGTTADIAFTYDDATPKLSGKVKLRSAPGADTTISGPQTSLTAGAALAFGDVCYMGADGKMEKGDADAVANAFCWAMAIASISEDAAGLFALPGSFVRNDAWNWATLGQPVYLDTATAGGMTQTAPSGTDDVIQIIGIATHADRIFFYPQLVQVEHT